MSEALGTPMKRCTVCCGIRIYDPEKKRFTACSFLECPAPVRDAEEENAPNLPAAEIRKTIESVKHLYRNLENGRFVYVLIRELERRLDVEAGKGLEFGTPENAEACSVCHEPVPERRDFAHFGVPGMQCSRKCADEAASKHRAISRGFEVAIAGGAGGGGRAPSSGAPHLVSAVKRVRDLEDENGKLRAENAQLLAAVNVKEGERRRHRDALQAWADEFARVYRDQTRFPTRDVTLFDACMELGLRVPLLPSKIVPPAVWRAGHQVGQTLYRNDKLVGFLDSAVDASAVIAILNRGEVTPEALVTMHFAPTESLKETWLKVLLLRSKHSGSGGYTARISAGEVDHAALYDFKSIADPMTEGGVRATLISIVRKDGPLGTGGMRPEAIDAVNSAGHAVFKALVRRLTLVGGPGARVEMTRDEIARADRFQLRTVDNGHLLALSVIDDT